MDLKVFLMLEIPDWDHQMAVIRTSQLAMEFCTCTRCSLCCDCPQRSMCWKLDFQPVSLLRDDKKVRKWGQQSEFSHLGHTLEEAWVSPFLLYPLFTWLILSHCETSSSLPQCAACHRPQSNRANQLCMETSGTISKMGVSPDRADNLGPFCLSGTTAELWTAAAKLGCLFTNLSLPGSFLPSDASHEHKTKDPKKEFARK